MDSFVTAVCVALLLFAGAEAADKELGQACTSSDVCVHPSLVVACDGFFGTCRLVDGQACVMSPHEQLCLSGAVCSSSTCTCDTTTYAKDSNNICVLAATKWAGACSGANQGNCGTSDEVCTNGKCHCVANKLVVLSTGICSTDISTSAKVGTTCTSGGAECNTGTGLACGTSLKCECAAGKAADTTGGCATITGTKVGKTCTTATATTDCGATATTHLECGTSPLECKCVTGFYGVRGGDCYPMAGKLGGGCSGTGQGTCSETSLVCSGTGAKMCKVKLGGTCAADADCADGPNAICDAVAKKCLLKTGQTCNTAEKKEYCTSGATCDTATTNQCKCNTAAFTETNNLCVAKEGVVGGACKSTDPKCTDTNAECDSTTTKCKCKTGYTVKPEDASCHDSGAIGVVASVMTVVLAALGGRLI